MVVRDPGFREAQTVIGHEGTSWGDGNVLYLDCRGGYTTNCMRLSKQLNYTLIGEFYCL